MKSFRRAVKSSSMLVVGLAVALFATVSVRAQVLDQVPSDALVVLKINHMQDTSGKLAALMQSLGVTDFVPTMTDPIAAFETQTGITGGLDKAGDAAFALLNGPWPGGNGRNDVPPFLLLLPTSDYKALLAGTTVVNTEGDISTVHFKTDTRQNIFVSNWGSFAAIASVKESLSKKPDGLKPVGLAARQLTEKDAIIYVNFPSLKNLLLPQLQGGREHLLAEVDKAFARSGGNANKSPLLKAVVNRAIDLAQAFLEDSQALTYGVNFGKNGVNTTLLSEFTPDSYMGKLLAQVKSTDQPLLNGLPSNKYLFFGGNINDPVVGTKVLDDLTAPIMKELAALGDQGKMVQDLIACYRDMIQAMHRASFAMVAPNPQAAGGLFQIVGVYKADAEKLKAAQIKQVQLQDQVMKALGVPNTDAQKTTVTPNAQTVDGVSFDQMKIEFNFKGNQPGQMQAQQMISFMYGPKGFIMHTGIIDPKTLVTVAGGNDQLLSDTVAAAKADADNLGGTDTMKAVDAELPKMRVMVFYIPLDTIVSTAVGFAGKFGFPVPVQLPPNLPPIGVTAGTEGSALRIDSYVPTQLVQSLIQAGMQVFLQLRGGQGGGGGAGGL